MMLVQKELEKLGGVTEQKPSELRRIQTIYLAERKKGRAALKSETIANYEKHKQAVEALEVSLSKRRDVIARSALSDTETLRSARP